MNFTHPFQKNKRKYCMDIPISKIQNAFEFQVTHNDDLCKILNASILPATKTESTLVISAKGRTF
jgi:hypothetical protein